MLLSEAISDVRSTTGSNLRNIMLTVGKTSVNDVDISDVNNLKYFEADDKDKWRIPIAREIIDAKANTLEVPGFEDNELETILEFVCTG